MLGHAIQTERNTTAMQLVKKIKKKNKKQVQG